MELAMGCLRIRTWVASAIVVVVACGSEKEESKGGNYSGIADAVSKPTGTLSSDNASEVVRKYEAAAGSAAGGERREPDELTWRSTEQTQSQMCPYGGSINIGADSSGSAGHATYTYANCCLSASDCCINGGGDYFYATGAGATYTLCLSMDINYKCELLNNASASYRGCLGQTGWTYSLAVEGKSFSASGSSVKGTGTLTIVDSQVTWTCTMSNYAGTCTAGATNFTFK
jgi:hypothetical protein